MIPHIYQTLPGWFDFQDLYASAVEHAQDGARFCEVGNFMGKSLSFLATEIVNSGKRIELWSVDNMAVVNYPVDTNDMQAARASAWNGRALVDVLRDHLEHCLTRGLDWTHLCGDSAEAASSFADGTFDFVFIDADHTYEHVLADMKAWFPKVKSGGRIAGHDHITAFPGVEKACEEFFYGYTTPPYFVSRTSWFADK